MNKGTTRHPKYFCDKCGVEIRYTYKKGFVGLYTYASREKNSIFKKKFDLCTNCEKKLRIWLKEKEIPTLEEILSKFPVYVEVGGEDER